VDEPRRPNDPGANGRSRGAGPDEDFDDVDFDDPRFDELDVAADLERRPPIHAVVGAPLPGFPGFEHNQWTIEGEIERFGAFGRGAATATGWKRVVAVVMVVIVLAPIALGMILQARIVLGR
jgi:hypothetical protein